MKSEIKKKMESDPRFIRKLIQDTFTQDLKHFETILKNPGAKNIEWCRGGRDAAKRYMSFLTQLGVI